MVQAQEMTFESLPPSVQEAINLLRKVKDEAIRGVGSYGTCNCPVAMGYSVIAEPSWSRLSLISKGILVEAGWGPAIYNEFIDWHDSFVNRKRTKPFLERLLE